MISVEQAERLVIDSVPRAPAAEVALADAHGEVLREAVRADRPFPPYDRVVMDGIALAHAAWQQGARAFAVEGIQRAGEAPRRLGNPAACMEVMTGAVLPQGCDCVVPVEDLTRAGDAVTLADELVLEPMQCVHRLGSDRAAGAVLVSAGVRMLGPQIAAAASVGCARIRVSLRPRIDVISTGDELVAVDAVPDPHQVRRSNGPALRASLAIAGFHKVTCSHVADDPDLIQSLLAERLEGSAFLVLSGGVSEGRYDHVPGVLKRLGVREVFHRVSQSPGKPLWFGVGPSGQVVFGLPGNPVSAVVCLHRYVLPALWAHLGAAMCAPSERQQARLAVAIRMDKPLTLFQPVRVWEDGGGTRMATPVPMNGSGDLAGLATSDGFLELAAGGRVFEAGSAHPVWLWWRQASTPAA